MTTAQREHNKSTIPGAPQQADAALLVLNAARGEFESGLAAQTREHILLAKAMGVGQLIVAINQMDTVEWDHDRHAEIVSRVTPLLSACGLPPDVIVPVSALHGLNLTADTPPPPAAGWYTGPPLLVAIDSLQTSARDVAAPSRLCVNDVFGSAELGALGVGGTLQDRADPTPHPAPDHSRRAQLTLPTAPSEPSQAGAITVGDRLILMPGAEAFVVKVIRSRGAAVRTVVAGGAAT